jgi:adenine-specific DNA methylase
MIQQLTLQGKPAVIHQLPTTRYQGSKSKIAPWIWGNIKSLKFNSALDAFGGTGVMGYLLKTNGKQVFYNDVLKFNYYIGVALIENDSVKLSKEDIEFLLNYHPRVDYGTFIQDTFQDIYYTDEENRWLDMVVANIEELDDFYKKAVAYYALFQACIIKRPFNLFHRKNLYVRFADVDRSFGNKATWDKPFDCHFRKFIAEINNCVFSNGMGNKAFNLDAFDIDNIGNNFDLIYIDTPYISKEGVGVDYLEFYHFLEGIVNYGSWDNLIDHRSRHRKINHKKPVWCDKTMIHGAFNKLFEKFRDSTLVVSYRSDGIPPIDELKMLLGEYKDNIKEVRFDKYKYVLSNNHSQECLLIGV